jgi:putative transposase
MKNYQTTTRRAGTTGRTTTKKARTDAERSAHEAALALPDTVSVAVSRLAGELEEGLLAFAVGAGLQVLSTILEAEVTAIAGPKGKHDPERTALRHGSDDGVVTLGGRQVSISRPRVRTADGTQEVALPTYELVGSTELLGRMAMERMLAKVSTRRYGAALEPVGSRVEDQSKGTSRSAVSRRFVAATQVALDDLMGVDLTGVDLVALMIDGVHFAGHTCVVALGIDIEGTKHPLAVVEGDTENATLVTGLLVDLARARARRHHADLVRPRRCQGADRRGEGRLRPPGDRSMSTAQDPQRQALPARQRGQDRRATDACRLREPGSTRRTGGLGGTRQGDRAHAPWCRRIVERGSGRDVHRRPVERGPDAGPDTALDERCRVHDRDLPGPLEQREALGRRSDGAAVVCRRDGGSQEAVPPGQRPPASEGTACCSR